MDAAVADTDAPARAAPGAPGTEAPGREAPGPETPGSDAPGRPDASGDAAGGERPPAPDLYPALSPELAALVWRREALGQGLEELARRAGLRLEAGGAAAWRRSDEAADAGPWLEWAAGRLGVEAEPVEFLANALERGIAGACPAVLALRDGRETVFLLLLRARSGTVRLIGPDLGVHRRPAGLIRAAVRAPYEAPLLGEIERLLGTARVPPRRRARVRSAILRERLATQRIAGCWILRPPATAPFRFQLSHAGLPRRLGGIVALLTAVYAVEIGGWALIGDAALGGRLDLMWLAAWLLLVASNVPLQLSARWLNATFALDLGRVLKKRLLAGALRMNVDAVRHQGVGQLLGRVMEAQALESLALNGGMAVVVAGLELAFAAWILSAGAGGRFHVLLLLAWLGATAVLCRRSYRRLRVWSAARMEMTHDLVERMVGHRTRLAQEWPERRDREDDRAIKGYLDISRDLDRAVVPVGASASGGWKLAGLLGLAPAFVAGTSTPAGLAIAFGGIMLANRAFTGIANGIGALAQAGVAWNLVSALFHTAGAAVEPTPFLPAVPDAPTGDGARLIDASEIVFRYRAEGEPVLRRLDLSVRHGERLLLEGASGGGKSTLAALLTGLRVPESGLLLLNGLDRQTLGAAWHQLATEAPQFHENHILSGPLGFNLLMGRNWPASDADLEEAREVCVELGLGDLLERMPAGLMQQIGETGWQLSQGERSRIFLARALLQNAPLTILDESFAALDPETLRKCLDCAFRRARTLIVIAHP